MTDKRYSFYFLTVCLFWGGSFIGIYYSLQSFEPLTAAFLRTFVSFLFMFGFLLFTNRKALVHEKWWLSMAFGLCLIALPWSFLFWGAQFLSPAIVAILNGLTPLFIAAFTPLLSAADKISFQKAVGIILGFVGVTIIFLPKAVKTGFGADAWAVLAITIMAIFYAVGTLWVRRTGSHIPVATNVMYQSLGASLLLAVEVVVLESPAQIVLSEVLAVSWMAVLYLGVCSTAIAWMIYFAIVRDRDSLAAGATVYLVPVVSIVLDAVLLQKFLTPAQFLGGGVILVGLALIQKKATFGRMAR